MLAGVAAIALSVVAVAYGATRTTTPRSGSAACGVLMSNPKAVKAMRALRAEHQKEMQEWVAQYRSDPSSAEAQSALQKLRQEHWSDMQKLFRKLGIEAPATGRGPGSGMMRGAGGSWGGACGAGATGSQSIGYGSGMMGAGSWN